MKQKVVGIQVLKGDFEDKANKIKRPFSNVHIYAIDDEPQGEVHGQSCKHYIFKKEKFDALISSLNSSYSDIVKKGYITAVYTPFSQYKNQKSDFILIEFE